MSEFMTNMIAQAEEDLLHTYNRYQVVLERGEGVYLYDTDGKKYLDFMSGIGVYALGYGNPEYNEALKAQVDKILHTSNYFYNEPAIEAAHRLKAVSGMDRVFFTNSGAEAVEGALKAALKHFSLTRGCGAEGVPGGASSLSAPAGAQAPSAAASEADLPEIIAMEHSFHGRTLGALAVTGNAHYREGYGQLPCRARFAQFNDLASVEALVNENTAGIILETVQGEGGVIPAEEEFLVGVRRLCDDRHIPLVLDEVQCGMGRTGYMYAWQKFRGADCSYAARPDIMTTAKALGCGVPVGAFLVTEEIARSSLTAGDHGTTYGGNPFAAAAVNAVLDQYEKQNLTAHVQEIAPYLIQKLDEIAAGHDCIIRRRGSGLMQALVFDRPVASVIAKAMEKGLIMINAGANVLRFLPPLVIMREQVDEMVSILEAAIEETEN